MPSGTVPRGGPGGTETFCSSSFLHPLNSTTRKYYLIKTEFNFKMCKEGKIGPCLKKQNITVKQSFILVLRILVAHEFFSFVGEVFTQSQRCGAHWVCRGERTRARPPKDPGPLPLPQAAALSSPHLLLREDTDGPSPPSC